MIKNKLVLLAILAGTINACGGRSAIRVNVIYDGGEGYDGGTSLDGKPVGLTDAAKPADALADGLGRDGSVLDDGSRPDTPAIPDGKPDGSTDVAITDGRLDNVGRLDNGGQTDGARPDGVHHWMVRCRNLADPRPAASKSRPSGPMPATATLPLRTRLRPL